MPRLVRSLTRAIRSDAVIVSRCAPAEARCYATTSKTRYGQPLHESHPHILRPGEPVEYHERRARLAKSLPRGGIAILPSAEIKARSGAVFYQFHQQPDFFYLTGFTEPESVAVIAREESELGYSFHLFVRPKDDQAELWDGARSGTNAAREVFNADEGHEIGQIGKILPDLINSASTVYTDAVKPRRPASAFSRFLNDAAEPAEGSFRSLLGDANVQSLRPVMNQLRLVKSEAEIANMRRAGRDSGRVFTDAMRRPYREERQLWNDMSHGFRGAGLDGDAYVPVIAGAANGLSIHYVRNDDVLEQDKLVLADAGGEYGGYITDITRTWPVSGKFSAAQRDMYTMVLEVQRSCVGLCRENANVSLDKLHRIAEQGLKDGLRSLGFDISGDAMDVLFPHHVGHYIGLDVHDAPGHARTEALKESHCITIEPGVYVPDDQRWPAHFRGMAVRIEDSVCITKESPYLFTTEAVKELVDIEALRH